MWLAGREGMMLDIIGDSFVQERGEVAAEKMKELFSWRGMIVEPRVLEYAEKKDSFNIGSERRAAEFLKRHPDHTPDAIMRFVKQAKNSRHIEGYSKDDSYPAMELYVDIKQSLEKKERPMP